MFFAKYYLLQIKIVINIIGELHTYCILIKYNHERRNSYKQSALARSLYGFSSQVVIFN